MFNKPIKGLAALMLTIALMTSSCASLFTKSKQEIMFKGIPGSLIIDKNKNQRIAQIGDNGFAKAQVRKQWSAKPLLVTKDGYQPGNYQLDTKIQGWFWGNLIFGGLPGMGIDALTKKAAKYKTDMLDVTLNPLDVVKEEVVEVPKLPEAVKKADTKTEEAIIRWFFDSDPRGARVFWRVISNVPNEVHNTNESYLTTTPLEETRSFNIPGLTYDNAQAVTVEIKVSKRGYEDQVKRFNVRQALDQQEISGFFELVPKN